MFVMAAVLLSANIEISKYGFILFLFGHIIFSVIFTMLKDWSMASHNIVFLFIDVFGIYRWWF